MNLVVFCAFLYPGMLWGAAVVSISVPQYMNLRKEALDDELTGLLGASLELTDPRESMVNKILMTFKEREFQEGMESNGKLFPAAHHFFRAKHLIEKSNVFKIIKILPKGGGLHLHLELGVSMEYLAQNITKWDHLYYCVTPQHHLHFRFSNQPPIIPECAEWNLVEDRRKNAASEELLDHWFYSSMSLHSDQPEVHYPDTGTAWETFERKITTVVGLTYYEKAAKDIFYQILLDHYNDNHYYLNQSKLTPTEILKLYIDVTEQFKREHPDFIGAKYIYAPQRFSTSEDVQSLISQAIELKEMFPNYIAGFDLVGQEDKGFPLVGFIPQLLEAAKHGIKFFFHSGETDWFGTSIDENLIDAALLNTSRFAHAFALFRHPHIYEMAKKNGMAVEVCPISNQILRYIEDLRIHPSTTYLRDGFPIVIASDDPGIWGALPLSHDWYVTFMAIAGRRADLRLLKQLAINSIKYSATNETERTEWLKKWTVQWSEFLDNVIKLFPGGHF